MMQPAVIFAAAVFAIMPVAARADWQSTRWGETPDEVLQSGKFELKRSTPEEIADHEMPAIRGDALLHGVYETADFKSPIWFYFSDNKLTGIYLAIPNAESAATVGARLAEQYGTPADKDRRVDGGCTYSIKSWDDGKRSNRVRFSSNVCDSGFRNFVLIYSPINQSDSGL